MLRSKLFDGLKQISSPPRTRNSHRDGARRRRGFRRPGLECLERRELLSVAGWAISFGSSGDYDDGFDTAADASGNVYVTGRFEGTVDFDPDPTGEVNLTSQGGRDAFVAKYSPTGALIWAKSAGTAAGSEDGRAIAVDGWGNATVTFSGDFWHLDANGNTLWSQAIVSPDGRAYDVAVDADGYIYIAGSFTETADFGDTPDGQTISLTSAGWHDIFVAKYAPTGEVIWAQRAGSPHSTFYEGASGIAVDGQDPDNVYVYLTGRAVNGAEFGGETIILSQAKKGRPKPTGAGNIFVAKLGAVDGTFQWTSMAGGMSLDRGRNVTVDGNADVYITGAFGSVSASFGSHTINLEGDDYYDRDAFAAKLDPSGNFLWASGMGGSGNDRGWSVSADDFGNLYVAGNFDGTGGDYGPFELTYDGPASGAGFLEKLDAASGNVLSAQVIGWGISGVSVGSDGTLNYTGAIKTDASGEEFPTGETLISTPTTNGWPSGDIFVSKMEPGKPGIRRLSVSPDPITQGGMLTLSAHGVLDIGGRVASVAFYRDANGDGLLDAGDELLGTDTDVSDAWGVTVSTATFPLGPQTYFAVATDNVGDTSDAASATGEVVDQPPAGANDIYVGAVQFDSRLRGRGGSKHDERIVLTVRNDADANGADGGDPVLAGVAVSVTVTGPGSFSATLSGVTDSSGVFTSTWLSNLANGTYTALVTDLSLDPFSWNQGLGQLSATHEIPHTAGASSTSAELTNDSLAALDAVFSTGFEQSSRGRRIVDNVKLDLLLSL